MTLNPPTRLLVASLPAVCVAAASILCPASADAQILSDKRGFADVGSSFNYLQASNAGWYYGWRPDKPAAAGNFDAEFLPMIWAGYQANQFEIDRIKGYGDVEWVLGFNEPERPDQANMSVAQAISDWTTLSNGFAGSGIKLVSPGVADTGGADGGQQWLADFMSQANAQGLQVDGVAFHWYGVANPNDPIGAGNSFLSRVDSYYNSYGLPVFVTEFGIIDWGGAYTDEQMREANAIFLEYVIPRLESRAHVEKYAFYQWTGDTTLIEGNPLTPTNVGREYVGALEAGTTYDFGGDDLGAHVAYLNGGSLVRNTATPGTIRHINALGGSSSVGGSVDWGLSSGNWVRVQPNASLRKTGTNTLTLTGIPLDNQGTVIVSEGTLHLTNGATADGNGTIVVNAGGTLDVSAPFSSFFLRSGQTLDNNGSTVIGDVIANAGTTIAGHGNYNGNLIIQANATLRVGGAGIGSSVDLIDNFDGYNNASNVNLGAHGNGDVTGGVWDGVFDGTNNGQIVDNTNPADNALVAFGVPGQGGGGWRGAVTNLSTNFAQDFSLGDGDTATYFFRVMNEGNAYADTMIGLTEQPSNIDINDAWQDFSVMPFVVGNPGSAELRANGTTVAALTDGQWQNVWVVVDNAGKTFDIYTSTGNSDGSLALSDLPFSVQASPADLAAWGIAAREDGRVRIDDLYLLPGESTSNPLAGSGPVTFNPETMMVAGNVVLRSGSTLSLDIAGDGVNDLLNVTGNLDADGTFQVLLDPNAPALTDGDSFDLLDFGSTSGAFASLDLPTLGAGLFWDTSGLLIDGILEVVSSLGIEGDFDGSGQVEQTDLDFVLLNWGDTDVSDVTEWVNFPGGGGFDGQVNQNELDFVLLNWGDTAAPDFAGSSVPEPAALALLSLGGLALLGRRR